LFGRKGEARAFYTKSSSAEGKEGFGVIVSLKEGKKGA